MSNPEYGDDPTPLEKEVGLEREAVLRQLGRKLYAQADYYFGLFDSMPLVPVDSVGSPPDKDEKLVDFESSPGVGVEYTNPKGQRIDLAKRVGHDGVIYICLEHKQAKDEYVKGDFLEEYLIGQAGNFIIAQHVELDEDSVDESMNVTPIIIQPEEFLHRIATDFKAVPKTEN